MALIDVAVPVRNTGFAVHTQPFTNAFEYVVEMQELRS
jgi:hypothetical protein